MRLQLMLVTAMFMMLILIVFLSIGRNVVHAASPSTFKSEEGKAAYKAAYQKFLDEWPVPYEEVFVPTRFGATHVLISGSPDKPPLVLMHAYGASSTIWNRIVAQLSQSYRIYLVDIIGDANLSEYVCALTTRAEYAEWLTEVLDGLGIKQAHVGGLSYGGWLSIGFGLAAPQRVKSLVLLAPAASLVPLSLGFYLHFLTPMFLPNMSTVGSTLRWLSAKKQIEDPRLVELMYLALKHFRYLKGTYPSVYTDEELSQIKVPTLLLIGDKEVIYNPNKAIQRATQLVPHIEAHLVPNTSHLLVLENSTLVNKYILDFLSRVEAGQAGEREVS